MRLGVICVAVIAISVAIFFRLEGGHSALSGKSPHPANMPDAQKVLGDAEAQAGAQDKRVFLHFGAPWCEWCVKLDDVLNEPAVADAIGSDYVVTKIDTDLMANATDVQNKYQTSGGIPWYAVLTADGKVVSTSDMTAGNNIGFPSGPPEIDHVMHMLSDGHKHMTDAQIALVREAFTKAAAAAKENSP